MTWRWLISSRKLQIAWALCVSFAQGATVSGSVELTGTHPPNGANHIEAAVVVWLEPTVSASRATPLVHARILQRNKHFLPHVLPIEVGTTVDFPNLDPIFHNAFSSFDGQIFDIGLYPPGSSRSVSFRRKGVVRVFCNIHSTMSAVIVVLDTPYFVIPNASGRFILPNVPPGEYTLGLFDERATPQTLAALSRHVTVSSPGSNLGTILISEAGYLPLGHKNKYGMDYAPTPDYSLK